MKSVRFGSTGLVVLACAAISLAGCDAFISPQHRIARARGEMDSGHWGSAAIELRKVVQKDPRNAEAWLLLARLSLDAADASDAQGDLDSAMRFGAKGRELDALRARAWLANGEPRVLLDEIARKDITLAEPDRSLEIARADNELQQPDRALAVLGPVLTAHPQLADAHIAAAEALAREGKSDLALQQIDTAMAADPHSAAAPLLRGRILEQRGEFAAAEDSLVLALKRMSGSTPLSDRAAALADLTEARLARGKIDLASQSQASLAKLVPQAPITETLGARIKLAHGDSLGGISDLERVVANAPNYVQARMLLGAAQLSQGNLEQAQENLEQVVRQTPDNVEARKLLASVRLKLNEPDEALQVLTPALGEQAMDPQLYSLLGAAESRSGKPNAVLQALERAVQAHPQDRTLRLNLAQAYLDAYRPKDALQLLEKTDDRPGDLRRDSLLVSALNAVQGSLAAGAEVDRLLAAHPHDQAMLDLAATYFASQRQFDRARTLLQQALGSNPHDAAALLGLARVDMAAGDAASAEGMLRKALAEDPSSLTARITLADVLVRKRSFPEAQHLLESAQGAEKNPELQLALAQVSLASGDLKQANAILNRAIALQPGRPAIVNAAGLLLLQAHQYDAALARFRKATQLAPDNASYWLNAGRAQLALNQPLAAQESLDKATQIEPGWLPAVSALTLIDLRAKNFGSALGRVKQLLASHPNDPEAFVLEAEVDAAGGHLPDAATALGNAQRIRPTASVAVNLYKIRRAAGVAKPEESLQQWLALQPNDALVRTVLGTYYLSQRALRQASQQFEEVIEQMPADVVALNNLAWVYGELDDPRAQSVAERAYKLAPKQANVADTLGWILAQKHETQQALPLLAEAAKAASTDPDLQYHYAYVLAQVGKRAEAREILAKILAGNKNFDSRHNAERLLANLKA